MRFAAPYQQNTKNKAKSEFIATVRRIVMTYNNGGDGDMCMEYIKKELSKLDSKA